MRNRRDAWFVLEALLTLALLLLALAAATGRAMARRAEEGRQGRRLHAYFLLRGMAVELPHSRSMPRNRHHPLADLRRLARDLERLQVPHRHRRALGRPRLRIRREATTLVLEITGLGWRERREIPLPTPEARP